MMIEPISTKLLSVTIAQPGWFMVGIEQTANDEHIAHVLPIGAWATRVSIYPGPAIERESVEVTPLAPSNRACLVEPSIEWYVGVFAPGENPLPWAERYEIGCGVKITEWDVTNWMPSAAPVFAAADEGLWTDDFTPYDEDGDE